MNTIVNYDKILVIDNGKIVEYDTPQSLLSDASSLFYNLVNLDTNLQYELL
jgi:ATP-binding cassette subfamily C (CFTR/MRP) protein 1